MSFRDRVSKDIEKRFVVVNIAMKAGALIISLAAMGILVAILTRVGGNALAPSDKPVGREAGQPAQPAYTSAARIYSFPSAGPASNSGVRGSAVGPESAATRPTDSEGEVRYILAMMGLVAEGSVYRLINQADPSSNEAWSRWTAGVRPTNLSEFELFHGAGGAIVVRKGTKEKIDGMSVTLSAPRN